MTENILQVGSRNFAFQNVKDSEINILIGKSYEYNEMLDQLGMLEKSLANAAPENTEWLNELNDKIAEKKQQVEQFKQGVMQLAETFARIETDTTDRLKRAREFFEKGEFGEARAVLETELEQMNDEHVRLLAQRDRLLPQLKHNAEEFLVLAQTTAVNFDNPNRFEDTCRYFAQSIAAYSFLENLFNYAYFLWEHNQFHLAAPYYQRVLMEFRDELSSENYAVTFNNLAILHYSRNEHEVAEAEYKEALAIWRKLGERNPQTYLPKMLMTLNNLAVLHRARNEHKTAEVVYKEGLGIYRELAEKHPEAYLPGVAMTLNNLANLHSDIDELEIAEAEYREALAVRRELAEKNPQAYLPYVATTLNNLAILHSDRNEPEAAEAEYMEALSLYRELAKKNPEAYQPGVAMTLNNLANLRSAGNEYEAAESGYKEALALRRELAEKNPQAYLLNVAMTLINFAIFYQQARSDKERSAKFALEAVKILRPFIERVPAAQTYFAEATTVLESWGMSEEQIAKLVDNG